MWKQRSSIVNGKRVCVCVCVCVCGAKSTNEYLALSLSKDSLLPSLQLPLTQLLSGEQGLRESSNSLLRAFLDMASWPALLSSYIIHNSFALSSMVPYLDMVSEWSDEEGGMAWLYIEVYSTCCMALGPTT